MMRYLRALSQAISLTLKGETVQPRYPQLRHWIDEAANHLATVYVTADQQKLTREQRQALMLRVDGVNLSMQTILDAVHHNLHREYQALLNDPIEHHMTAIHASNLNDRYRIERLSQDEALANTPVQAALMQLQAHLEAIPDSD